MFYILYGGLTFEEPPYGISYLLYKKSVYFFRKLQMV